MRLISSREDLKNLTAEIAEHAEVKWSKAEGFQEMASAISAFSAVKIFSSPADTKILSSLGNK